MALAPEVDPDEYVPTDPFAGYRPLRGAPDQFVARVASGGALAVLELANGLPADPAVVCASPNFCNEAAALPRRLGSFSRRDPRLLDLGVPGLARM